MGWSPAYVHGCVEWPTQSTGLWANISVGHQPSTPLTVTCQVPIRHPPQIAQMEAPWPKVIGRQLAQPGSWPLPAPGSAKEPGKQQGSGSSFPWREKLLHTFQPSYSSQVQSLFEEAKLLNQQGLCTIL